MSESLINVAEAAARLGCSERFIRRLVQERRIPFFKVGGSKLRFSCADIEKWLALQRTESLR
jgi:excisionase family DNA binding protein